MNSQQKSRNELSSNIHLNLEPTEPSRYGMWWKGAGRWDAGRLLGFLKSLMLRINLFDLSYRELIYWRAFHFSFFTNSKIHRWETEFKYKSEFVSTDFQMVKMVSWSAKSSLFLRTFRSHRNTVHRLFNAYVYNVKMVF